MATAWQTAVVIMSRFVFVCLVTSIWPLIGPKWEPYIVEVVIEVHVLHQGNKTIIERLS